MTHFESEECKDYLNAGGEHHEEHHGTGRALWHFCNMFSPPQLVVLMNSVSLLTF